MSIRPLNKTLGSLPDCPNAHTDNTPIIFKQTQLPHPPPPFSFACIANYDSTEMAGTGKRISRECTMQSTTSTIPVQN